MIDFIFMKLGESIWTRNDFPSSPLSNLSFHPAWIYEGHLEAVWRNRTVLLMMDFATVRRSSGQALMQIACGSADKRQPTPNDQISSMPVERNKNLVVWGSLTLIVCLREPLSGCLVIMDMCAPAFSSVAWLLAELPQEDERDASESARRLHSVLRVLKPWWGGTFQSFPRRFCCSQVQCYAVTQERMREWFSFKLVSWETKEDEATIVRPQGNYISWTSQK